MRPPTRCSTGSSRTARRRVCPRRASTGVRGRTAAWPSSEAARANLGARGLIPLEPGAALNALGEVVAHGIGQAIAIKANWQRAAKLLGTARPPILDHVLPSAGSATPVTVRCSGGCTTCPKRSAAAFVTEHLQRELQQILGLRATAGRGQSLPRARHGLADGGRTSQPVARPVRKCIHDQRHRGVRLSRRSNPSPSTSPLRCPKHLEAEPRRLRV